VVCLGVTAAQSVFGKAVRLNEMRGRPWSTPLAATVFVTVHPSAILRHPEAMEREREYQRFVEDLQIIQQHLRAKAA
jgi:uracil-DNA glycosylase family 4